MYWRGRTNRRFALFGGIEQTNVLVDWSTGYSLQRGGGDQPCQLLVLRKRLLAKM
jgi:hypothetical protein